jgi:CubicO group peptidase (beta-lactamase class C family)
MERWLKPALDYVAPWLEFQMRMSQQPGCVVAVAHRNRIVLEHAFGLADLETRAPLTPRHRFRVASQSKSFTAAGVMKLRERGKLGLDEHVGVYVKPLHPRLQRVTLGQLLSHSAGLVRDGEDAGQFSNRRPFLDRSALLADLMAAPAIEPNTRFKYSNHGFGLLGLVIEAITGEPFGTFIKREIIDAGHLEETEPDMPIPAAVPMASGHSDKHLLGRRIVIPGRFPTNAIAPAGGVVSTGRDLALFFAQLSPNAPRSMLSLASRREMVRRQWRNPDASLESYYGLGTISGTLNGWDWFGHAGALQGYLTRTCVVPDRDLTIAVLTNAIDGWAGIWVDGIMHILRAFSERGAPSRKVRSWTGRWWSLWGAVDLVPMGDKVRVAAPALVNPFGDAAELKITGRDRGSITCANGYSSYGEPVRLVRDPAGRPIELWLAASKMLPEAAVAKEVRERFGRRTARRRRIGRAGKRRGG